LNLATRCLISSRLVRFESGDALLDLVPQGTADPMHRGQPGRFNKGRRQSRFHLIVVR
jgi:hypothetical protein